MSFLLGLIGEGIFLSRTPAMHEAEGLAQGHPTVYRRIDTLERPRPLRDLLAAAIDMGFDGLNITHPYKQQVVELLDDLDATTARLGAANTVVIRDGRTTGHNTDVTAYTRSLGGSVRGKSIVQVGAGGAGTAVAHALIAGGVERLWIADVDKHKAEALARAVNPQIAEGIGARGVEARIAVADGVVNATPMGMPAHPGAAFDTSVLTPLHWVSDVVYMPLVTPMLADARALGCATLDGSRMAVGQAADSFELFTGLRADEDRMRETFLSLGMETLARRNLKRSARAELR